VPAQRVALVGLEVVERREAALQPGELEREVQAALLHWHAAAALACSPLADLPAAGAAGSDAARAEAVRRLILEALERARAQATADQALAYRALELGYLQRGLSHERAAERLNVSRATFYRLLKRGVAGLAGLLDDAPGP
jgi:DNA-directed RNA polymerase specialized sigma24 family protein